ncbi:hypothetical protein Vadar_014592 [Vaccinium darrowii]|uniref:Uncharacterized protein n=1 Tax=Vaccinium darrowii TaxID=229202 RepID=A0ACB7X9V4_9ERIC|nr:hypothetical protein Vadar_014592 [Vaccinium darrowii]
MLEKFPNEDIDDDVPSIFEEFPHEEFEDDPLLETCGDFEEVPIWDKFEEEFSVDNEEGKLVDMIKENFLVDRQESKEVISEDPYALVVSPKLDEVVFDHPPMSEEFGKPKLDDCFHYLPSELHMNGGDADDDLKSTIFRLRLPKRSTTTVLQKWAFEGHEITVSDLRLISRQLQNSRASSTPSSMKLLVLASDTEGEKKSINHSFYWRLL